MGYMHTISLDKELSDYARTLPNSSASVQECLKMHAEQEIEIDFNSLKLRKKEKDRLEYTTMIERRLSKIEQILSDMKGE